MNLLMDTGSAVTLSYSRILGNFAVERAKGRVISANGQPLEILGSCECERLGGSMLCFVF